MILRTLDNLHDKVQETLDILELNIHKYFATSHLF